jgi:hypothetical protein
MSDKKKKKRAAAPTSEEKVNAAVKKHDEARKAAKAKERAEKPKAPKVAKPKASKEKVVSPIGIALARAAAAGLDITRGALVLAGKRAGWYENGGKIADTGFETWLKGAVAPNPKGFITIKDAVEASGYSSLRIYDLVRKGELESTHNGIGTLLVKAAEVPNKAEKWAAIRDKSEKAKAEKLEAREKAKAERAILSEKVKNVAVKAGKVGTKKHTGLIQGKGKKSGGVKSKKAHKVAIDYDLE